MCASKKNKMNAEDPDFEEASSIGDRASFVSNTSSTIKYKTEEHAKAI